MAGAFTYSCQLAAGAPPIAWNHVGVHDLSQRNLITLTASDRLTIAVYRVGDRFLPLSPSGIEPARKN